MALPGTPSQVHGEAGHGEVRRAFRSDLLVFRAAARDEERSMATAIGSTIPNIKSQKGGKIV